MFFLESDGPQPTYSSHNLKMVKTWVEMILTCRHNSSNQQLLSIVTFTSYCTASYGAVAVFSGGHAGILQLGNENSLFVTEKRGWTNELKCRLSVNHRKTASEKQPDGCDLGRSFSEEQAVRLRLFGLYSGSWPATETVLTPQPSSLSSPPAQGKIKLNTPWFGSSCTWFPTLNFW